LSRHQTLIILLEQWGLRDLLIPFILIFTLAFALLQKMKIFKKGGSAAAEADKANKKVNAVIAIGIALASLVPHYTGRGFDIIIFINTFLPNSFLLLLVVLLFLALIGTVSDISGKKPSQHPLVGIIAIIAVILLVAILLQVTQQINYPFLSFLNDPNTQAITIVFIVFALVIWYIARTEKPAGTPTAYFDDFKKRLQKLFGG